MNDFNRLIIEEFRANKGVVGGMFEQAEVIILHTIGRRTGLPRETPAVTMRDGDRFVLIGSNGGAEKEPLWVANLAAMTEARIEAGERELSVQPTILRDGPERERLYAAFSEFWPGIHQYEQNTDRPFPIIVLEPVA